MNGHLLSTCTRGSESPGVDVHYHMLDHRHNTWSLLVGCPPSIGEEWRTAESERERGGGDVCDMVNFPSFHHHDAHVLLKKKT